MASNAPQDNNTNAHNPPQDNPAQNPNPPQGSAAQDPNPAQGNAAPNPQQHNTPPRPPPLNAPSPQTAPFVWFPRRAIGDNGPDPATSTQTTTTSYPTDHQLPVDASHRTPQAREVTESSHRQNKKWSFDRRDSRAQYAPDDKQMVLKRKAVEQEKALKKRRTNCKGKAHACQCKMCKARAEGKSDSEESDDEGSDDEEFGGEGYDGEEDVDDGETEEQEQEGGDGNGQEEEDKGAAVEGEKIEGADK
ncbi:hypothetical protein PRZ48_012431 [Zasmidium cellare]|uniref:Uncharacterized protein n=1 Tax=Zasmidium cellare TaxID=395010 RepID=A0ABR0E5F2_ZASCE|nr:hypothetical protein PRZ48_012431 [Zasmidium cellare]